MARIIPIPTTRVGDFFVRQRLVSQVQSDQVDLFRLQNQVSTGRRIILPSDDAPAALRAINLQRTLQRKGQVQTNLAGTASVLGQADATLGSVSNILNQVRAETLGVADTISTDEERRAVINVVDQALADLVKLGNTNYAGRYIYGGSRTNTSPFTSADQFIQYIGNEKAIRNFVDLGQLFETNVPGSEIFGGLSGEVRGNVDLNPRLTTNTPLSSINGGEGIDTNAAITISVTSGGTTNSRIIDLSSAANIGDVARLIEANPPPGLGGTVTVDVNGQNGLTITAEKVGSTVRISEVAGGRTARELGIFTPATAPAAATIVGTDLNAAVRKTSQLTDLLGTKATARLDFTGSNNDLVLTAESNGSDFDDVTVDFVSDVAAGNESASYDEGPPRVLTVHIASGATSANRVAEVINDEGTFTAVADYRDASSTSQAGTGAVVTETFTDATGGGNGEDLDLASGLVLTNGGTSVTLDVSTAETVEDLLNLIGGAGVGLLAEINAAGNGIDVRSTLSGADFTIGENGGTTATQLGIRTYTGDTQLAGLNRGLGLATNDFQDDQLDPFVDDLEIVVREGSTLTIDLSTATTLQDVVDLINNDPANVGDVALVAQLTSDGHGIELVDSSVGVGDLTVLGSQAAETLGFLSAGSADITAGAAEAFTLGSYRHSGEDDLLIVARDGTELWVDLTGTATVQDVIDRVNSHPRNNFGTTAVTARLAETGNGIELVDASVGGGTLSVQAADGSQAAELLGFLPNGAVAVDGDGNQVLTSEDRNTLEVDSVFNTLIRLRTALEQNNTTEIGRAIASLDVDANRANFARAEIGSRLQSLDIIKTRLEDENVQLQSALSEEIDVDLVQAISDLTARQYALQASLQTSASILNLSILDYI